LFWPQIAYFGLWHYRASIDLVTRGKFDGAAMTDPLPWAMVDRRGFTSFAVNATTVVGQDICVAGHITALGAWDPTRALKLCAANYPIWKLDVALPAGTAFRYKYPRKDASGAVTWESGANRTGSVPSSGVLTLNDTWSS
jgi:alpha-amylase